MANVIIDDTTLYSIGSAIRNKVGEETLYKPSQMAGKINSIETYPEPTGSVSITENGSANVKNYATAIVNVPNTYDAEDEGKVVDNGALVAQTSQTVTQNGTYDTTTNDEVVVNVSGGGGGSPTILSGTDVPSDSEGNDGNLYLQYTGIGDGYTQVDYIESSGTQYIDTGIIPSNATDVEVEFTPSGSISGWNMLFGGSYANVSRSYTFGINRWCTLTFQRGDNIYQNVSYAFSQGTAYTVKTDGINVYINGTQVASVSDASFTSPVSMLLFATNLNGTAGNIIRSVQVSKCKIYDDGELVRYFIPAVRDSDSAVGLFDVMNQVFYENAGSGSFTAGSSVSTIEEIIASYVKVNGSWTDLIGADINDVTT